MFNKEYFDNFKKSLNIRNSDIVKSSGISRQHLWRILNNKCKPGYHFISKLKEAFPVIDIEKLFFS